MAYKKQKFVNGQVLTADMLNKIEDAIVENEQAISNVQPTVDLSGYMTKTEAEEQYQPKGEYLTSYAETDPTVPEWAKQPTKPAYTAQEVGAMPSGTKIPAKTSELENDSKFATEDFVAEKVAEAQLGGGSGEGPDLSAYMTETEADRKYQPKGEYLTEHQKLKTINGVSLVGNGNIEIEGGEPTVVEPYTRLEFIEGTEGQYIITDYYAEENDVIEVDYMIPAYATSVTGDKFLIMSDKSDDNLNRVKLSTYSNNKKLYVQFGETQNTYTYTTAIPTSGTISFNKNKLVVNGVAVLEYESSYTNTPVAPLRILSSAKSYFRVYELRVKREDELVHNYVPYRQNDDGVIGVLDTITNTFYANTGASELTYKVAEVAEENPVIDSLVQREQFSGTFATKDFLLKQGTDDTGTSQLFALLSTTGNARNAVIDLKDGHTYRIKVKNNNPIVSTWRMRIALWDKSYSSIKFVPAEDENCKNIPADKGTPASEILISDYQKSNSYEGIYTNSNNYKTLIIFMAWGIETDYLEVSVEDLDANELTNELQITMDNISEDVHSAIIKPWDKYTKKPITAHDKIHLTNILTGNMSSHNKATQAIMQLAYDMWKHRDEFMYSNGTARDNAWKYWSEEGYYDVNTGNTITAENAGWKKIDCSTFVYYVTAGIGYYSSPYYNMLEWTDVVQGALTDGVETDSDDATVCRTGVMQIRPGRPLILESTSSSKYYFTAIYGYKEDGTLVQTFDNISIGTTFTPNDDVRYLRAEMKVTSAKDYAPAVTTVPRAPAQILKLLRIRENEQLAIRGACPNSQRYAKAMCQWYVENGYEPEYNRWNYSDQDFPVGTIMWWGRNTATSNYRGITHITLYIGGGYLIHSSTGNMGLTGGQGIHIQSLEELFGSYNEPLSGIAFPEYLTDYSAERKLLGLDS